MHRRSGFTLIELLIVISIIGVLSVIGMIAYTTFLKNARDAKRQSDLKFIQSALEEYHSDQIYYPLRSEITPGSALKDPSGTKNYMSTIPSDPSYDYTPWPGDCTAAAKNCSNYCLRANMENPANAKTEDSSKCSTDTTHNYAIVKP